MTAIVGENISFKRYVSITSGVGGGVVVQVREPIARYFSTNNLIPPQSVLEFDDPAAVSEYFGSDSVEYLRASVYFSFISKGIPNSPDKLSFGRWVNTAVAPRIYGNSSTQTLSTWTAISTGSLGLTIGADVNTFTALDFSDAESLSDVAAVLQTAIRTKTGTQWTAATVTYDATRGSFDFVGGSAVAAVIIVHQGVGGVPIGNLLGWLTGATLIVANGSAVETITNTLQTSANISNNFYSFVFMPTLTTDQIVEAGTWEKLQNVQLQYHQVVDEDNASEVSEAVFAIGGVGLVLNNTAGEYPEQLPGMILASTDYNAPNCTQNYMFQQGDFSSQVNDDTDANFYDSLRVNYMGRTQTAGQSLVFFQRGVLMGLATDPLDMNTFANEQWLKDTMGAAVMTLLLALPEIAANTQGQSQIKTVLTDVANQGITNGVISVGKNLSRAQQLYVTEVTNDPDAWRLVQNFGYWLNVVIVPVTVESVTTYEAQYTLVYSKKDDIRKVNGTHVLI